MSLILKLICTSNNIEINEIFTGIINLKILHELLISWDFVQEEINNIKFFIDTEEITNPDMNFIITEDNNKIINILAQDININNKLEIIFKQYKNNNLNTLNENILDSDEIINNNDSSDKYIEDINNKTILLFDDPDFKNLLNIYIKKPELYNILYQYIQNVDFVNKNNNNDLIISIDQEQLSNYNNLADKLLFLGFSKNIIIKKLIEYKGHLNLTIRSLLQCKL